MLGAKIARPRWFDATAMCVGSMVPDLSYSFSAYVHVDTHRWPAAYGYGVPLGFVAATVTRRLLALRLAPLLPDLGTFRLRSLAVLADRRPRVGITLVSVVLGIWSHILLDWFTHPGRPGVRWLGYDDVTVRIGGHTEPLAGVFQLVGHSAGSLLGAWLLWTIGHRRLLDEWYGSDLVAARRSVVAPAGEQATAAALVVLGASFGLVWGWNGDTVEFVQRPAVGAFAGMVVAALITGRQTGVGRR